MSQQTHEKVVEVAAAVIALRFRWATQWISPANGTTFRPEPYVGQPPDVREGSDNPVMAALRFSEETTARYHLTCAATASADDGGRLAEAFWEDGPRHLGVIAVLLGVLEPDGAVRLVGTHGLPLSLVSAGQRVPRFLNVAFLRAVADGRPLWISSKQASHYVCRAALSVSSRRSQASLTVG